MNGLVKTAQRVMQNCVKNASITSALVSRSQAPVKRDFTRGIWHMSCSSRLGGSATNILHNHSNTCSCGCGLKALHTKGERELVEFLTEEIVAERKAQKLKTLPAEVEGFQVKGDGAEVVLTKQLKDEIVKITFNVNHTVDSEDFGEGEVQTEKQEFTEMRSKPQFEVDLVRGDATLGFTCSFLQEPPAAGDEYNDIFGIDEVTLYKGEWSEKVYAVAGDVLDGYLYDLLMNLLEEKGVSNEFVQKLSDFSTAYEHSAYIAMLEGISQFTIGKK
ncbi:PREDICTED: complement component 1 Q subcomponent-binding protein, mitochondrial isoform X2 [Papilio xuthus]|uniref:Complement component 1 Q subcomponent-binding protein, mitochondrial isoform X2 n=1 Tax=Papilio xuthus TaxID=66420 RepID=I4DJV4_PAPXU|nr:PREDICTED: complement component 1 Q subcomponent-binding protein, mitochondrial isoform X2 [Papilio xuthus]BAM18194.1 similar to CG6459 [Papilio xuthus]